MFCFLKIRCTLLFHEIAEEIFYQKRLRNCKKNACNSKPNPNTFFQGVSRYFCDVFSKTILFFIKTSSIVVSSQRDKSSAIMQPKSKSWCSQKKNHNGTPAIILCILVCVCSINTRCTFLSIFLLFITAPP